MGKRHRESKMHASTEAEQEEAGLQAMEEEKRGNEGPVEASGMEIYWKLASVSTMEREEASVALVCELQAAQKAWEEEEEGGLRDEEALLGAAIADEAELHNCAPLIRYALRRLVRGVSSSRQSARQGFALALASVLGALDCIRGNAVLSVMKKNLEVTSGREARDKLLGQIFAYGAIVRSGMLLANPNGSEQIILIQEIIEQLLVLAKKKSYLREPATVLLVHLMEKLPGKYLQDVLMASPMLKDILATGWDISNADTLLLLLCLSNQLTGSAKDIFPFISDLGDWRNLFTPSRLSSIVPCLKDSSYTHPRLHPVWSKIVDALFADAFQEEDHGKTAKKRRKQKRNKDSISEKATHLNKRLAVFWDIVVDKALLDSSHDRKHLTMELLLQLLPQLPASAIHIVLSQVFVHCILDILSAKDAVLYKCAERFLQQLCQWAKEDEHRIIATVISFQEGSHGKFDGISRTHTVSTLISNLISKDGCFFFFRCLKSIFVDGCLPSWEALENGPETVAEVANDSERLWALDQMSYFCKQAHVESVVKIELQKELLKFLASHALFTAPPGTKFYVEELGEALQWPKIPLSENIQRVCLERLQGFLVDTHRLSLSNKFQRNVDHQDGININEEDIVSYFLHFCDILDRHKSVSYRRSFVEVDSKAFSSLKSALSQVSLSVQTSVAEQREKLLSMRFLLLQLFLQPMISHTSETLMELLICCKKAFWNLLDFQVENDEESESTPPFIDVLVDILLSLLAQASSPVRYASELVFKSFQDDISDTAFVRMLQVVKKQLKNTRHNPLDQESDDDQMLSIEDSDDNIDSVEDTDDDLSSNPEVPATRNGIENGEMDEPDSDADDDAMFRVDAHLARILNQKKMTATGGGSGNKDAETQLNHFKFRVLSLLEFFIQKKANTNVGLIALPHLLRALVLACAKDGSQNLADRIGSILQNKVFKAKLYPRGSDLDTKMVEDLLQRSLRLASRSRIKKVSAVAQASSLWLIKVLHSHHPLNDDEANALFHSFQNSLEDFFAKKKSRLKSSFFQEAFARHPWLGRNCLKTLLDKCLVARSEYLQYEALSLVSTILHPKIAKKSSEGMPYDSLGAVLEPCLSTLSEVLVSLSEKPASRAARRSQAKRFSSTVLKLLSQVYKDKPLVELIGSASYNLCANNL